jgi:hypothetical protein
MITSLRSSTIRLAAGGALGLAGLVVFGFVLPGAAHDRTRSESAAREAAQNLQRQKDELRVFQAEANRIREDRRILEELLQNMPAESVGSLGWKLSQKLWELSKKNQVHLVSVKYGAPSREGAKDSILEAVDVEFTVTGIYQNLKPFMLSLEGSKLPFAVASAKLDESPDGAHLTVVLRAFRQRSNATLESQEGA